MNLQEQRIEMLLEENAMLRARLLMPRFSRYQDRLILSTEDHFKLPNLTQKTRRPRYVKARSVVAHIMRQDGYSLPEIGDALNCHHTTILNLLDKYPPADFDIRAVRRAADATS